MQRKDCEDRSEMSSLQSWHTLLGNLGEGLPAGGETPGSGMDSSDGRCCGSGSGSGTGCGSGSGSGTGCGSGSGSSQGFSFVFKFFGAEAVLFARLLHERQRTQCSGMAEMSLSQSLQVRPWSLDGWPG